MKTFAIVGALAATAGLAAPAAAQTYYPPQGYPQQSYPQQTYQQGYAVPGYPQQGYGQQGGIAGIIGQLLGNRYQANDRTAVTQCAAAAQQQASAQYRPQYQQRYQQGYQQPYGGYPQQYAQGYNTSRVTAITQVARIRNGVRVTGLIDSGMGYGNQAYPQGYPQQGYNQYGQPHAVAQGDLTFRCNVDYRGQVTNLRVTRNRAVYRR